MSDRHLAFWPKTQPRHLSLPNTHLFFNAEVSAARYPDKPFLVFYDTPLSFGQFKDEAERIAGFLQRECGVGKGDRVLLYMQNSPQFVLAYYGILRADAVVVPVNPMNMTEELRHYVRDTGATAAFAPQDLLGHIAPLLDDGLKNIVAVAYSDYIKAEHDYPAPAFISAPREQIVMPGVTLWSDMLARGLRPGPMTAGPKDLAVMP
jgi:fatty-acyl-CoA synthase